MDTIFFVAFEFPPLGGVGVQRSLKFVKYLAGYNVKPVVITVKAEDYASVFSVFSMDEGLCKEIPEGTIIERIHCPAPKTEGVSKFQKWSTHFFSVVENFDVYWREELEKQVPQLIKKYSPKAIYITLPPFAMGPLWRQVLKNYNIPVIVDFRDAWTQWCVAPNASYIHYQVKLAKERQVLEWATRVICSSKQIMIDMQRIHPAVNANKFSVINNGFDDVLDYSDTIDVPVKDKFIIGYVGSFYYTPDSRDRIFRPWYKRPVHRMIHYVPRKEDWLYRSPYFFFKAVSRLLKNNPALANKIEIRFAGKTPGWLNTQIKQFGLEDICKHHGYLKHDDALAFQKNCDALLITSSKVLGGRDYSIAGKTYEYFTMGKPILGFVCEGEQKDILEESKLSVIFNPDDEQKSAAKLEEIITKGITLHPDKAALGKYHRKLLAAKLAELVQRL